MFVPIYWLIVSAIPHNHHSHLLNRTMPSNVLVLDNEWATSLVGLPMNVPNSWWPRSSWAGQPGTFKNRGIIKRYNPTRKNEKYFMLELLSELGAEYPMRYNGVIEYADDKHSAF